MGMNFIRGLRTVSLLALLVLAAIVSGCSDYKGRYGDGNSNGKFVDVTADSISIWTDVDGSFVSNSGRIASTTKSPDGKTITLTGEVDYSGGSGTAFGVTVQPGQERHWTKPFTATINTEKNTMDFQGTLIVNSLTMRTWNVTLKKQ
jgi:hypothetical protein